MIIAIICLVYKEGNNQSLSLMLERSKRENENIKTNIKIYAFFD